MGAGITEQDIGWALTEAVRLHALREPGHPVGEHDHRGELVAAVEFLRLKAGARSELYLRAADAAQRLHSVHALEVVVQCLVTWVDMTDKGYVAVPVEAQARVVAATDLMEQVDRLLDDRRVIPAAPVMLVGAALEELLRSMLDAAGLKARGKPGITNYAAELRRADLITAQEAKDIASWAGLRSAAVHGQFDQLERPNARLMAQAVNLFMQKHSE